MSIYKDYRNDFYKLKNKQDNKRISSAFKKIHQKSLDGFIY